jgi:hypothetical protein
MIMYPISIVYQTHMYKPSSNFRRIYASHQKRKNKLPHQLLRLYVDVAEWTSGCAHKIPDRGIRSINTNADNIIKRSVSARWVVLEGDGTTNSVLSVLDVLVLPNPPGPVNLSVVEEEDRVSWGGEDISSWVTSADEVTSGVNTVLTVGKVSLHDSLEIRNSGVAADEVGDVLLGCVTSRDP